jgi:hypothetical protein
VYDLTVEHEWHTFVANRVVVHNTTYQRCLFPDGGTFLANVRPLCECPDGGTGRLSCSTTDEFVLCTSCGNFLPDGGLSDGGR